MWKAKAAKGINVVRAPMEVADASHVEGRGAWRPCLCEGDAVPEAGAKAPLGRGLYRRVNTRVKRSTVGSIWYTFVDAVRGFNQIRNTKRACDGQSAPVVW